MGCRLSRLFVYKALFYQGAALAGFFMFGFIGVCWLLCRCMQWERCCQFFIIHLSSLVLDLCFVLQEISTGISGFGFWRGFYWVNSQY